MGTIDATIVEFLARGSATKRGRKNSYRTASRVAFVRVMSA